MININRKKDNTDRRGAALLIVLSIVMVITILALGFLSRSDVELACGQNMALRVQMDSLVESGLQHAKGLILNPQDIASDYWAGASGQQLVAGSDDYYDVSVVKLNECNYQITSTAYRLKGGEQIGRSSLQAELRLDPTIVLWQTSKYPIAAQVTVNGDIYSDNDWEIYGNVNGDVFTKGKVTNYGNVLGQQHAAVVDPPISLPGLVYTDFSSHYYIGSSQYSVDIVDTVDLNDVTLGPTVGNPAGIYYCDGTLGLADDIVIDGTLVVKDDLRIRDNGNVTITAGENFPALIVGHDVHLEGNNGFLSVTGLAQIDHHIDCHNKLGVVVNILGGLYILGDGIRNTSGCTVTVTAAPKKAAIEIWSASGTVQRWSPAAGAFFRSIQRK